MSFPLLPFCKQTQIPRLKSASELYNFKLSNNGKVSWRLAEAYAVADRILQILTEFYKFGGVYDSRIFWQIFSGSKNLVDPDIRRRLGSLP